MPNASATTKSARSAIASGGSPPQWPAGATRYVRNTAGIARALGFKLGKRALAAKCREISDWIQRPDFPAKTRMGRGTATGWVVEEILEWAQKFAAELAPQKQAQAAMLEVLTSDNPSKRALHIVAAAAGGLGGELPATASGLTAMAEIIARHFHVDCRKQYVHDWRHGKKLPAGAPPFPPPDPKSNRFNVAECLAWYQKWQWPSQNGNGQTPDLFADLPNQRAQAELEEIEHERWVRQRDRGGWMEVAQHQRILAGLGKQVWTQFCEVVERRVPAALDAIIKDLGEAVPPEVRAQVVAALRKRCQEEIDQLQRQMAERVAQLKQTTTDEHR